MTPVPGAWKRVVKQRKQVRGTTPETVFVRVRLLTRARESSWQHARGPPGSSNAPAQSAGVKLSVTACSSNSRVCTRGCEATSSNCRPEMMECACVPIPFAVAPDGLAVGRRAVDRNGRAGFVCSPRYPVVVRLVEAKEVAKRLGRRKWVLLAGRKAWPLSYPRLPMPTQRAGTYHPSLPIVNAVVRAASPFPIVFRK
jgi:hypothetical protein